MIYCSTIIQSPYIFHELNKAYQDRVLQLSYFTPCAELLQADAEQTLHPTWLAAGNLNPSKHRSEELAH